MVAEVDIQQAATTTDLEALLDRIGKENPDDMLPLYVGEVYRRFGKLSDAGSSSRAAASDEQFVSHLFMTYTFGSEEYTLAGNATISPSGVTANTVAHLWTSTRGLPEPARALGSTALWELRAVWGRWKAPALPTPFVAAQDAIASHVRAAEFVRARCNKDPSTAGMIETRHWRTAIRIATELKRFDELGVALSKLFDAIEHYSNIAPHWALGLIQCVVDLAKASARRSAGSIVSLSDLQVQLDRLDALHDALVKMKHMEHVEKEVLDVRAQLEGLLGAPPDQQETSRRMAELLVQQAGRADSQFTKAMYLKHAAEAFAQAGLRAEAATAKGDARAAISAATTNGEVQEINTPMDVPPEVVDSLLAAYFEGASSATDILGRLGQRLFAPSLEGAQRTSPRSLASRIAVTIPIVDDRALAEIAPDDAEAAPFAAQRALVFELVALCAILLSSAFERLRSVFALSVDDLVSTVCPDTAADADKPFITIAAERYLAGDHVSAVHVLVPRLEQMTRRHLINSGVDATAIKDGATKERTFGELIREGKAAGVLPEPLARLLQAVLAEEWGLNFRNRVAHGLLTLSECTAPNVERLWHVALVLAAWRRGAAQSSAGNQTTPTNGDAPAT
ncbi:DUF4209 domain-containing protein [Sorangium sp. So ce1014]|uniref:DUF4209 domain-containing protein n=1 Tax=Sorangium sp. So ce1014 TaxID=3133326 RepID=UPI003F641A1F